MGRGTALDRRFRSVSDTLVGLGLASVGSDRVVRWNDKGRAIAAAVRVDRSATR